MQISDIEQREISDKNGSSYRAALRNLCEPFDLRNLLVHEETLLPGDSGSRPHYHTAKEEIIVILEGLVRVSIGDRVEELGPGAVFGFPPGVANRHFLTNVGTSIARYLSIGTVIESDRTIYE